MEESTVVRVDEAVPRVPPVHNRERSPVITPSRVSNYQDSIRDSKSPSRDSESMDQNEKETEKSREKMEVDEEDKEGIKKLLRERAKEIRVELDLQLRRAFRTAFTRIGTEKNIIVGGFFFYNRFEEYPTAESIQKGLLEVLPDLEILPLENWPGTAMDGRNVVVKVEEWKTAWEVRKKILEVGGRLAEKWNRVFRWKDFLDHHLWSFEFIGAMGEWEPVNIIETLLVNGQFPSRGLKYLVRVRGSSCQRKVRLVYEDVPVLMIQMLSQERIARGVPVQTKNGFLVGFWFFFWFSGGFVFLAEKKNLETDGKKRKERKEKEEKNGAKIKKLKLAGVVSFDPKIDGRDAQTFRDFLERLFKEENQKTEGYLPFRGFLDRLCVLVKTTSFYGNLLCHYLSQLNQLQNPKELTKEIVMHYASLSMIVLRNTFIVMGPVQRQDADYHSMK